MVSSLVLSGCVLHAACRPAAPLGAHGPLLPSGVASGPGDFLACLSPTTGGFGTAFPSLSHSRSLS